MTVQPTTLDPVPCPWCASTDTEIRAYRGRYMHRCADCGQRWAVRHLGAA